MGQVNNNTSVSNTPQVSKVNETKPTSVVKETVTPQAKITNDGATSKLGESVNTANSVKTKVQNDAGVKTPPSVLSKEATVTKVGDQVIIDSGAGDDKIGVTQDPKTGDVTVNVNGESQTFSGKDKDNLVIKAGDGNDNITVDKNVTVHLRLEGGNGDDFIKGGAGNDKIEGGYGNDRLHGGEGHDYINGSFGDDVVYGDNGDDTVYGGDGKDKLYGNAGADYLEGGKGNDEVYGNAGNDVISGGRGDDYLRGNGGDDAIYAGEGKDTIGGDSGNNKIYSQTDDKALVEPKTAKNTVVTVELKGNPGATSVSVVGSDEFKDRVESDLDMLRSSPNGRQMLEGFDDAQAKSKVTVTIQELNELNGYADWENRTKPGKPQPFLDPKTGAKGTPNNVTIAYNPSFTPTFQFADAPDAPTPPSVVLFHEMAHAYDMTHGTLRNETYRGGDKIDSGRIRSSERVAVGIPIDHDNNPKTAEQTDDANHPKALTENALREEMNLQLRMHYILTGVSRV